MGAFVGKDLKPWERQEGEGPERWEAFLRYRELGLGRSLVQVAQNLGKSNTLLHVWSSEGGWVARAEAYDREQDRLKDEARNKAVAKIAQKEAESELLTESWVLGRMRKIADLALKDPIFDDDGNVIATKTNFYGAIRSTELLGRHLNLFREKEAPQVTNNYAIFLEQVKKIGLPQVGEQAEVIGVESEN